MRRSSKFTSAENPSLVPCKLVREEKRLRAAQAAQQLAENQRNRGPSHNPNPLATETIITQWWAEARAIRRDIEQIHSDNRRYGRFGTYYS